jgi:hypothetical protein
MYFKYMYICKGRTRRGAHTFPLLSGEGPGKHAKKNPFKASYLTLRCLPTSDLQDPITIQLLLLEVRVVFRYHYSAGCSASGPQLIVDRS